MDNPRTIALHHRQCRVKASRITANHDCQLTIFSTRLTA
jgi:hypothetical protein